MFSKLFNKIGGAGIFFIIVTISYLITLLFSINTFVLSIIDTINILKEWMWLILIIFILMLAIDLLVKKESVKKLLLSKNSTISWLAIIISGIISAGPIYMWYPILNKLKKEGLEYKYIAGFLYNRSIKIPLLLPAIEVYGAKLVTILVPIMIIFSVINGYIVEYTLKYLSKKTT